MTEQFILLASPVNCNSTLRIHNCLLYLASFVMKHEMFFGLLLKDVILMISFFRFCVLSRRYTKRVKSNVGQGLPQSCPFGGKVIQGR